MLVSHSTSAVQQAARMRRVPPTCVDREGQTLLLCSRVTHFPSSPAISPGHWIRGFWIVLAERSRGSCFGRVGRSPRRLGQVGNGFGIQVRLVPVLCGGVAVAEVLPVDGVDVLRGNFAQRVVECIWGGSTVRREQCTSCT